MAGDEQNGRATIREVYEIAKSIEDKIDSILQRIVVAETHIDSHVDSPGHPLLERRIDSLERWRWMVAGGLVVVVTVTPFITKVVLG